MLLYLKVPYKGSQLTRAYLPTSQHISEFFLKVLEHQVIGNMALALGAYQLVLAYNGLALKEVPLLIIVDIYDLEVKAAAPAISNQYAQGQLFAYALKKLLLLCYIYAKDGVLELLYGKDYGCLPLADYQNRLNIREELLDKQLVEYYILDKIA